MSNVEKGLQLTERQKALVERAGKRAVAHITRGRLEFQALSTLDRLRAWGIPSIVIQESIHAASLETGIETQSFRAYSYKGDSTSEFSPLMVRVIGGEQIPGFMPVRERGPIPDMPRQWAIDVYPPQE